MASPIDQETALKGRDLPNIFRVWEEKHQTPGFDPVPFVIRLAELFEEEAHVYLQKDPDPFDERHPSRTDPHCEFGRMLKLLFRKDNFMTRLVNDYLRDNFFTRQSIQKSSLELNIAACRLILVIMPGLETSAVFQIEFDTLIQRLYAWATDSPEPLQSYATGLLAAAMELQEIAISCRDQNAKLVPLMLKRLHSLQSKPRNAKLCSDVINLHSTTPDDDENDNLLNVDRPFAHLGGGSRSAPSSPENTSLNTNGLSKFQNTPNLSKLFNNDSNSIDAMAPSKIPAPRSKIPTTSGPRLSRNTISFSQPTMATSQFLILRYLTPMGEYQEFLVHVFEFNAMQLIFHYIENVDPKDTCLEFESLKYLAALLCHKKFCLEFINHGGLERLLLVPRPSLAATGVSISLYYLAYCEDAMERICTMPQNIITDLVSYTLWLLGSSHDSGRCHATMFFGLSFQFKVILDEFDSQDGLRKLYNVISVLPILEIGDDHNLNEDEECSARQIVRHVCVTLKKYMESHLYFKYTQVTRQQSMGGNSPSAHATIKASISTPEVISEQVKTLQEMLPMRACWAPIDDLINLGGITLLLRVIACADEWNYNGRADTVRSVLDILTVCCVLPKVHHTLCDRIPLSEETEAAGLKIILGAAEGEIAIDVEVQKAALSVLIQCVCAPIHRPTGSIGRFGSAKKKTTNKSSEELIQNVWECVRLNNGIIILLHLMQTKGPITDADCIRGMACRALAGLARSDTVKQIMSKLPLFTNGQFQILMRDPILQEKRADHVMFQKYALELMERVSGKSKSQNNEMDSSLANIHKASVVAQTKIQFNEQQLYQLINEHLLARGLTDTASSLQRELGLTLTSTYNHKPISHHSPFSYRSPAVVIPRPRVKAKQAEFNANLGLTPSITDPSVNGKSAAMETDDLEALAHLSNTPIRIIKKTTGCSNGVLTTAVTTTANGSGQTPYQRSMQKQISSDVPILSQRPPQTSNPEPHTNKITLETIITEYLTNQHALCKNPMSTCPQFDLFVPHKCPDPRPNKVHSANTNFAARFYRRQAGFSSRRLDRRLVHSNFSVVRILRPQDADFFLTSCTFSACSTHVIVGSYNGDVKVFSINQSVEEFSANCHNSPITSIKCNRDGNLVLMSARRFTPMSTLWNIENKRFTLQLHWDDQQYCEFSNTIQDKILGTNSEKATIFDLKTGQKILTFVPTNFNHYTKNRATFCPTDELILSDGVLWDVRSGKDIHKFDKLNSKTSGIFHPNGLEIISNTEVWDLRTFHLLKTVPILDQCEVLFSPQNVIYGIRPKYPKSRANSSDACSNFKTLDSYDYSSISTIDVKRYIHDLSVNKTGSQISIVENQGVYESGLESVVRIYNVGRKKNMEDDNEEDDDDMDGSGDPSMSDGDDSVIINDPINSPQRLRNRRRGGFLFRGEDASHFFSFSSSSSNSSSDDDDDDDDDDNDEDDNDNEDNNDNDDNMDDDDNIFNGDDNENDDDDALDGYLLYSSNSESD